MSRLFLLGGGEVGTKGFKTSHSQLRVYTHRHYCNRIFPIHSSLRHQEWTATWSLAGSVDQTPMWIQRHQGLQTSTWPPAAALITEAFQGDNSENEPFFFSDILLLRVRVIVGSGSVCVEQKWGTPRGAAAPFCGPGLWAERQRYCPSRQGPGEVDLIVA